MSDNQKPQNKNNKRRHNSKRPSGQNSGVNKNKPRSKKNYSKNRRPKSLTPAKILQKYDNLLEQYITARKKFFEYHGRNSTRNLRKIENTYSQSLNNLRNFENKLRDWQKDVLAQKVDGYKPDREYSTNHDLEPVGDTVSFTGDFEDPHLLETQKAHEWSEDTEESEGTIEDYEKYKASSV